MPLDVASTTEEKVTGITANPVTATGQPARVDGGLRVTPRPGGGDATAVVSGLSVEVISGPVGGLTVFDCEVDADTGPGVRTLSDVINYNVTSAEAQSFGLSGGTVVPK